MILKNKRDTILFAILLVGLLGILKIFLPYELNLFVFYFLPVALIAWHLGVLDRSVKT